MVIIGGLGGEPDWQSTMEYLAVPSLASLSRVYVSDVPSRSNVISSPSVSPREKYLLGNFIRETTAEVHLT